jgi:integrase/recombinase XerC/integrase/recombinase XerD
LKKNSSTLIRADLFLKKIPDSISDKKTAFYFISSLDSPSSQTVLGYSHDIMHFANFCNPNSFCNATRQTFRDYKNHLLKKGLEKNSIKRYIASLSSFYHFLVDEELIETFPIPRKLLSFKSKKTINKTILDEKMVKGLLAAPDRLIEESRGYKKEMLLRDKAILFFLYKTGIRNSELRLLEKKNINLEKREALIHGKGSKIRTVVFDQECREHILNYLSVRNDIDPILFRSKKGGHMSIMSLNRLFQKYKELADIDIKATPHILRHTFASRMLEKGANIKFISEFLGHSSVKITLDIYSHLSDSAKKNIYDSIAI